MTLRPACAAQSLETLGLSFTRLSSDLLLTGWDPELEHGILMLELELSSFMEEEAALDAFDNQGPSELELQMLVRSPLPHGSSRHLPNAATC